MRPRDNLDIGGQRKSRLAPRSPEDALPGVVERAEIMFACGAVVLGELIERHDCPAADRGRAGMDRFLPAVFADGPVEIVGARPRICSARVVALGVSSFSVRRTHVLGKSAQPGALAGIGSTRIFPWPAAIPREAAPAKFSQSPAG
jgi:hypothetical protein